MSTSEDLGDYSSLSKAAGRNIGNESGRDVSQLMLFNGSAGSRLAHFHSAQAAARGISQEGRSGRAETVTPNMLGSNAQDVVERPGYTEDLGGTDISTPGGRQEAIGGMVSADRRETSDPDRLPVVAKDPKKRKRMAARSDRPGLIADPKAGGRGSNLRRKNMLGD